MSSVLNEKDRRVLAGRIDLLTGAHAPRWGRMSAEAMLGHLGQSLQMALGELAVGPRGPRAFRTFPLKHLILYVLPFPKGARTAPELRVAGAQPVGAGRAAALELLERLGAGPTEGSGPAHPLLGPLSRQEWGVLAHKHADHHLRQFGV